MIEIQENYKDYQPPKCAAKSISRFIRHTPEKYLSGLSLINLTNTEALNRKRRRGKTWSRKRKVHFNRCNGWYSRKWKSQPAQIVLLIDNIFQHCPTWAQKFKFTSDAVLSHVFFHELGHHIHRTQMPEYEEREDVADKWANRLARKYFWKRYWHILILVAPFKPFYNRWRRDQIRKSRTQNEIVD